MTNVKYPDHKMTFWNSIPKLRKDTYKTNGQ